MSYDLMVFAKEHAPRGRQAFLAWYGEQSEWEEDHSYSDPVVATPELRAWFLEIVSLYPAMNGPFAPAEWPDDDSRVTDYSIGRQVIYAAFAWSVAEAAYQDMFRLAAKHGVGFFNASSEGAEVWLPNDNGGLTLSQQP